MKNVVAGLCFITALFVAAVNSHSEEKQKFLFSVDDKLAPEGSLRQMDILFEVDRDKGKVDVSISNKTETKKIKGDIKDGKVDFSWKEGSDKEYKFNGKLGDKGHKIDGSLRSKDGRTLEINALHQENVWICTASNKSYWASSITKIKEITDSTGCKPWKLYSNQ